MLATKQLEQVSSVEIHVCHLLLICSCVTLFKVVRGHMGLAPILPILRANISESVQYTDMVTVDN